MEIPAPVKAMRCLLSLMRVETARALVLRVEGESWSSGRAIEGAESAIFRGCMGKSRERENH